MSKFLNIGIAQSGKILKMKRKCAYRYKTLRYIELCPIAKKWYPDGRKSIPSDLILTPTILQHWYIGDGNYSRTPLIDSTIFSMVDLERIVIPLRHLGLCFSLREFKDRKRIRIFKKSERDFFAFILSESKDIPECYKYKFPKEML